MRRDLFWRGVVAALTIGVSVVLAPAGVIGVAVLATVVLAAEPLTRWRGRGLVDEVVVGVGGVAVAGVVLGVLLAASPLGLTPQSWGVGMGVAALVALRVAARGQGPRPRTVIGWRRPELLRALPWAGASLVVVAVATGTAFGSTTATAEPAAPSVVSTSPAAPSTTEPTPSGTTGDEDVDMTLDPVTATDVQVVVSAGSTVGPLEVRVAIGGTEISYPAFWVSPGQPQTVRVTVPPTGTAVVSVVRADGGDVLASEQLDR